MYATGPRKISSTRIGPFGTAPSCPPASAATDDMSTEIAPRRPRGSITPEPLRGKRDPSAPTEPLSDIRKPVDPDVAVTASETSLAETVEPPDPHAASAAATTTAAAGAASRSAIRRTVTPRLWQCGAPETPVSPVARGRPPSRAAGPSSPGRPHSCRPAPHSAGRGGTG